MRLLLFVFMILFSFPSWAAPKVVATIAPLAGIAAAVMDGVGMPDLLIKNNASPHTYQMKPSDMALVAEADIVVWDGEGLENFLAGKLSTLAPRARLVGLLDEQSGARLLPVRTSTEWEADDDGDAAVAHDPHAWLDPVNAVALARYLSDQLAEIDPVHAEKYRLNAHAFAQQMAGIDADIKTRMSKLQAEGFIVFHDGYQYFTRHYGLKELGAITLAPDVPPSARRLAELQERIRSQNAACVFAEPQFSPALVETLVSGTQARIGTLNPDASDLPVSPHLYEDYLLRLTDAFSDCLMPG